MLAFTEQHLKRLSRTNQVVQSHEVLNASEESLATKLLEMTGQKIIRRQGFRPPLGVGGPPAEG